MDIIFTQDERKFLVLALEGKAQRIPAAKRRELLERLKSKEDPDAEVFRALAREQYTGHSVDASDGDIDIDQDAVVSESEEGAYVAAWVWVYRPEGQSPSD